MQRQGSPVLCMYAACHVSVTSFNASMNVRNGVIASLLCHHTPQQLQRHSAIMAHYLPERPGGPNNGVAPAYLLIASRLTQTPSASRGGAYLAPGECVWER